MIASEMHSPQRIMFFFVQDLQTISHRIEVSARKECAEVEVSAVHLSLYAHQLRRGFCHHRVAHLIIQSWLLMGANK